MLAISKLRRDLRLVLTSADSLIPDRTGYVSHNPERQYLFFLVKFAPCNRIVAKSLVFWAFRNRYRRLLTRSHRWLHLRRLIMPYLPDPPSRVNDRSSGNVTQVAKVLRC